MNPCMPFLSINDVCPLYRSILKLTCSLFQDDLIGKSVYNIIHIGDHDQFNYSLLPMSLGRYSIV